MNKEDVIRMAREAGFVVDEASRQYQPKCIGFTHYLIDDELEHFAALVAAAEREACAKVCEDRDSGQRLPIDEEDHECAAAIRARGQA